MHSTSTYAIQSGNLDRTDSMTMTEPLVPPVLNVPGWFQTACRALALSPSSQRPDVQREASEQPGAGAAAPWLSNSCHHTAPDAGTLQAAAHIEPQDWDLHFRAVLETVARLAKRQPSGSATPLCMQATSDVLGECMQALDQLRRSVPVQRLSPPATDATDDATTSRGPASATGGS